DGRLLPIEPFNKALFSLLGVSFGGDGINNFALPDFRGRAAVGVGQGQNLRPVALGEHGGAQEGVLQPSQMPRHPHTGTARIHASTSISVWTTPKDAVLSVATSTDGRTKLASFMPPSYADEMLAKESVTMTIDPAGEGQAVPLLNPYLGLN